MALAGCADAFAPPQGAERWYPPPVVFDNLWSQVEGCAQLSGDMRLVRWYVVPRTMTFPCAWGDCRGLWSAPHNIYLSHAAAHNLFLDDFFTVRHEMLHDLVGHAGHPPVFEQCGLMRTDSVP